MEVGKWYIFETGHLGIAVGDTCYIPTARDIFLVEFKGVKSVNGLTVSRPSEQLTHLKISKFPLSACIQVTSSENENISVRVCLEVNGTSHELKDYHSNSPDHVIINDVWYPIACLPEVRQLITQSGITDLRNVTLREYAVLRQSSESLVKDYLARVPLNKGSLFEDADISIPGFSGDLYPYQRRGVKWMKMISEQNAGCILADEMGLGKTAQVIALLTSEKGRTTTPSLVVCPATLLENWRREIAKFSPSLKVGIHQGTERTGYYSKLLEYDVVITSYDTVVRDTSLFDMIDWNIAVVDEAQAIKNPFAKRTKAVKQLKRRTSVAVTGTPVENRLLDMWSLADFSFPGFLGDQQQFENRYADEVDSASSLEPLVSPIMLRRRVTEVAQDLPQRIDIPQVLCLENNEAAEYESIRQEILSEYGQQASLVSLTKLRVYCTHPLIYKGVDGDITSFGKYTRLVEILDEILASGEKVIIFTSFKEMVDLMLRDLSERFSVYCDFIDGRVSIDERQPKVDKFSAVDGPAILVLNPRAAGVGLNVTAANHVIHYNLEWNPAIEDQASARAYRRGQVRPVSIHRMYLAGTVEETINYRIEMKRGLFDAAVVGNDGTDDRTSILSALMKSPRRIDQHE